MDKQQLLSFIQQQVDAGNLSKGDLLSLAQNGGAEVAPLKKEESSKNLIHVFYAIGAIIAIIGVGILVAQKWDERRFAGRVLVTLGISVVIYLAGLTLRKPEQRVISQIMFIIAAALAPLGSFVLLKEAHIDFDWVTQLSTACVLAVLFGVALVISKRNILLLVTIAFLTWAYYTFIMKVFGFDYYDSNILQWAGMLLGASYLFVGYGFKSLWPATSESDEKEKNSIQHVLYGFGALGILSSGISIGGLFDLIFIAFIFAAFYGSVYLKSRAMLIFGALFLMAHIIKITSKYFLDSVGWPVALIVIGFLVIGVGYMTFYLNKRFISRRI